MTFAADLPRVTGRHRNRALARARAARSVELAASGHTYEAIAAELGYASRGTVHRMVHKELRARTTDGVDLLRAVRCPGQTLCSQPCGTRRSPATQLRAQLSSALSPSAYACSGSAQDPQADETQGSRVKTSRARQ